MIIQAILNAVYYALTFILSFLPDVDQALIAAMRTNAETFRTMIFGANWFFPVDVLYYAFFTWVSFVAAVFTFRIARLIMKNISGGIVK
jgi:hypothetical protein